MAALALSDGIAFAVVRGIRRLAPTYTLPALRPQMLNPVLLPKNPAGSQLHLPQREALALAGMALRWTAAAVLEARKGFAGSRRTARNA